MSISDADERGYCVKYYCYDMNGFFRQGVLDFFLYNGLCLVKVSYLPYGQYLSIYVHF